RPSPVDDAHALREQADYSAALDIYQTTLAEDPNHPEALWGVAVTHVARQDSEMAADYLNRYIQRHPRGEHIVMARQKLAEIRGLFIETSTPAPELIETPEPNIPPGPPRQIVQAWDRARDLEQRGDYLNAITSYAALTESSADGAVRAGAFERMARCEAQRPPFDFPRIKHFYLRAARVYRDIDDQPNSARCKEMANLAQEYARVKAEQEKLAEQQRELEALVAAQDAIEAPEPRESFALALEAYQAGDQATAIAEATKVRGTVPEASFILGITHAEVGAWDDARLELREYLQADPSGGFAAAAKRELAAMRGKRPLLIDSFRRGAVKWRLRREEPDITPLTEAPEADTPGDGICMRLEPGHEAYTSFGESDVASITLTLLDDPVGARPMPVTRINLYSDEDHTCAPFLIDEGGYAFIGQREDAAQRSYGWRVLTIDVTGRTVSAQIDDQYIGEVPREGPFSGLSIQTDASDDAGPLLIDEVRIVEFTTEE
ncbi:MAG TPA: tetratricopeptide repeat protein, partial [Armatimonadota bacterium]|nr:tetratricopeptide repeat protein [Armatimonadota bacterium]